MLNGLPQDGVHNLSGRSALIRFRLKGLLDFLITVSTIWRTSRVGPLWERLSGIPDVFMRIGMNFAKGRW
jgi:hypothetical protein